MGGVFRLVLRDERFDGFLQAADYLRRRLDAVRLRRRAAGEPNVQPTFADIEESHLLYIRAAYRPFVSVASEYTRVRPHGHGTSAVGPSGGSIQFTFPTFGHFTSDIALHLRFRAVGDAAAAAAGAAPTPAAPLLRYCAYPGLRAAQRVEFRSDEVLIDDYTPDDAVAYGKFFVATDHRPGWDRCHGQQELRAATYTANGFTGVLTYADGPQTPKLFQEELELFVPLQFWMCRDAAHALLNDLIPNSQRTIVVELAPLDLLIQALVPAPAGPAPDPLAPAGLVRVPLPFQRLAVEADLYVNGLYVNPEIHDVFASRIGFGLCRVHRRQTSPLIGSPDRVLLDQLKYPAEFFAVGFRDRANAADFDRWWMMGTRTPRPDATKLLVPAMVWNAPLQVCQLVCREAVEATTLEPLIAALSVTAHGIEIFPQLPAVFYNAYMPCRYPANSLVVAPVDASAFLVSFCLYPGRFNPSGYYNLSAGRELYIGYVLKGSYDLTPGRAEMVVSMSALNFLIRRGDKFQLKFSL